MTRFQFFLTRWYVFTKSSAPWWSSACPGEGAYPPRSSNQSVSTRRAQLSVAAGAIRPTELLNHVKTWVNTRKAFSSYSTPLGVVTVRLYVGSLLSDCLSLCCGRTAPEVSEEEDSYASRFYGSARFNWPCTVASLKPPAMIACDVATKVLDTE